MSNKIYLQLFFLCVIVCQGIFATLSDEDTGLSSDVLSRKRRVINNLPGGRGTPRIETVSYIVKIKEETHNVCAGSILSHYSVITAASCVIRLHVNKYKVLSGAASNKLFNYHDVTSKAFYYGSPPHDPYDGIALITVDPPFQFGPKTGFIQLYAGPLNAGTIVTVVGWGYRHGAVQGTEGQQRLRSIVVPIINYVECLQSYLPKFTVTPKHICTYHEQQCCARCDEGAPLIINDKLTGIHVWRGEVRGQKNPDVFIDIRRPDYHQWIIENALLM